MVSLPKVLDRFFGRWLVGEMEEGMAEVFLRMIDDRNLTTHTYIAELASAISTRLPEYAKRMHEALGSLYQ